jgi:hypothetical protein
MTLSSLLAMVILLRVLFIITESNNNSFKPTTTQKLRNFQANIIAYQKFKDIHKNVIMVSAIGGKEHKYNLCFNDHNIINIIDEMLIEAFPDSIIEEEVPRLEKCESYKIHW